jgi:hypothetical protein
VFITFSTGDVLIVSNTLIANLHQNDFVFVA